MLQKPDFATIQSQRSLELHSESQPAGSDQLNEHFPQHRPLEREFVSEFSLLQLVHQFHYYLGVRFTVDPYFLRKRYMDG